MSKFNKGDTVTLTATIAGEALDADTMNERYDVTVDGRKYVGVINVYAEKMGLVKRAAPPEPPIGTVMTYFGRNNKWVRTTDGWHFIRQGDGFLSGHENNGSGAKWETFQHEGVKVIG